MPPRPSYYGTKSRFFTQANHLEGQWSGYRQAGDVLTTWDTGVDLALLRFVAAKSVESPSSIVRLYQQ